MAAADGRCKISIFYSIQRTEVVEYDVGQVERAFLSPQTRAYVFNEDRMRVGRVTDFLHNENGLITYEVSFPNGKRQDFSEID
ncbi:MAG: hypothetical protein E5V34_03995, partial [Mesorhizobium sp.]